jgi:voltage-gated potassium channel
LLAVLSVFEATSCGVFSLEYALRLWASVEDPRYSHPLWGRLRFATRPVVVLDLLAIAPALLALGSVDTRFLRLARLSRLLRVLKLGRYSRALRELAEVIRSRTPDLVSALFVMLLLLLSAAIAVFFAEHDAQPEVFSNVTASLWWAIVTMTTVGYGDVFPITTLGRVLAAAISILGIGLFALPAGIIADGYRERLGERRRSAQPCRHCGHVPSEDER